MILPVKKMIKKLSELRLPIYVSDEGHKCHFKDVCIQLTKQALQKEGVMEEEDFVEEEMLLTEWHTNYDTLKNQN